MRILTLENKSFSLNRLPDSVDDSLRFAVLDNSNPVDPDFFFNPLIFLESFNSPAIVLEINGNEITMPLDWCVAVGCSEAGSDLEVLPLTSLNDRGFKTFTFNPLSSFRPEFLDIDIVDVYQDVKWYFPKMRPGQLLCTTLEPGPKPRCAYFVKEVSRQSELIDYTKCW
jgi:hypothetical protein